MKRRGLGWRSAFTLIEMLIVIMVIAILIGVLLPQFRGAQDEAAIQRAKSELRTIATAIESYYIHNSNTIVSALTSLTTASPRIISSIPDDPFRAGSNDYSFYRDTNAIYYVVFSYGQDRAAAITSITTGGVPQCTGANCATSIDDICVTNGSPPGAPNC
ncbi:MAG: type II secretion system protein [Candidatus Omnitrophica bacterium]|nr:type II secretion system protein [Candidatus Omnitrophota bacterium]